MLTIGLFYLIHVIYSLDRLPLFLLDEKSCSTPDDFSACSNIDNCLTKGNYYFCDQSYTIESSYNGAAIRSYNSIIHCFLCIFTECDCTDSNDGFGGAIYTVTSKTVSHLKKYVPLLEK